jgi:hypothetical protein
MSIPIIKGRTQTVFGTDLILPDQPNVVVQDYSFEPKKVSVEEAGNHGSTSTTIDVDDGWDCNLTCMNDAAIDWPAMGDVWNVKNPMDDAAKACDVESITPSGDRTKAGSVKIKLRYRPDRDVAGGAPAP